jgi:asparagine synthase (glutamine-hydrolysing)
MTDASSYAPLAERKGAELFASLDLEARVPQLRLEGGPNGVVSLAEWDGCTAAIQGSIFRRSELEGYAHEAGLTVEGPASLALGAYLRLGARFLERLNGVFALVLWDGRARELFAVRDPMGLHPLFHALAGDELLVAASLETLACHPSVRAKPSRAVVADHLLHRWPDPAETFYTGIRRVPPGHALHVRAGRLQTARYWHPVRPGEKLRWVREDELEHFDDLFDEAVARCLEVGPAGIYLSGGLDSVSVAAVTADRAASRGLPGPLALSLLFPDPSCNEESIQRAVAARLGMPQVFGTLKDAPGHEGLLQSALDISAESPAPLMNLWYPAYEHLALEAGAAGRRVILTGAGGDEWLGVSPFLAADLLRRLRLVSLYRLWNTVRHSYQLSNRMAARNVLWRFGVRPLLRDAAQPFVRRIAPQALERRRRQRLDQALSTWLAPDPELRRELVERTDDLDRSKADSFYLRDGQLALDHTLVSMEFEEWFEAGRRTGVSIRMPFWDADLVDFLYRTPPAFLNRGQRSKGLVRDMLDRRFPELGFERHRKVISTPVFGSVIVEEGPRAWSRLGGASVLGELGVIEPASLNSTIEQVFTGPKAGYAWRVWDVLTVEAWLRARV